MSNTTIILTTLAILGVSIGCPVLVWAWAVSLIERTTDAKPVDQIGGNMTEKPRRGRGRPQPHDPLLDLQERLMNAQALLMDLARQLEILIHQQTTAKKEVA